jgi:iron transport multicopper oxidase
LYVIHFFLLIVFSHCHIDWHVVQGMVAQIIEAPLEMQQRLIVPAQVEQQCLSAGIPISGAAS